MLAHSKIHEISGVRFAKTFSAKSKRLAKKERAEIPFEKESRALLICLVAINQRLWKDIKYHIRLEPGVQTPEETLEKRQWFVP